jgi:hypothetical protein
MLHTSALARLDLTPVAVSPSPPVGTLDVRRHARQRQQTRRDARMAVLVARQPSLSLTVGMAPRTGATGGRLVIALHTAPRAHERKTLSSLPELQHASFLCAEGVCSQLGPKGMGGAWARLAAPPLPPRFISLEECVDDGLHSSRVRSVPVT